MKELIIWSEGYSVNNKEIDDQHKKLIELINKLYNSYLKKDMSHISEIIKEIKAYTMYHFSTEEKLMRKNQYPEMLSHIKMHENFIDEFNQLLIDNNSSNEVLTMKTMTFLQKWLTSHILKEDKKYRGYI